MKGVILAAGRGTRLYPLTKIVNKQLLQIYDKPMIYYPLSVMLELGIKEILIITSKNDLIQFEELLGNGSQFGVSIKYDVQKIPLGIADAFRISKKFIKNHNTILLLGDNIFYGHNFLNSIKKEIDGFKSGAVILGYHVSNPERFGVVEFNTNNKVLSIEEKPSKPKSNYAIPGLYIYDNKVVEYVDSLDLSQRGELEITDLNKLYLKEDELKVLLLDKRVTWLDTGTPKSLIDASNFVSHIESRQGYKISCLEQIAFENGYITFKQLKLNIDKMPNGTYKQYLNDYLNNY